MGQRTIQECDLCKKECEDQMPKITIKKPGKRTGNSYDLCTDCSQALQSALVGDLGHIIATPNLRKLAGIPGEIQDQAERDENDLLLESKGVDVRELREPPVEAFVDRGEGVAEPPPGVKLKERAEGEPCPHANRTGPKMGSVDGRRTFYTRCRDCDAKLPMKTSQEKAAFSRADAGGHDIQEGTPPKGGK